MIQANNLLLMRSNRVFVQWILWTFLKKKIPKEPFKMLDLFSMSVSMFTPFSFIIRLWKVVTFKHNDGSWCFGKHNRNSLTFIDIVLFTKTICRKIMKLCQKKFFNDNFETNQLNVLWFTAFDEVLQGEYLIMFEN